MSKLASLAEIIENLKTIKGITTDRALGEALGMRPSAFNNRKKSGSVPYGDIHRICIEEGLSLDEVFGVVADKKAVLLSAQECRLHTVLQNLTEKDREAVINHALALFEYRK